MSEHEAIAGQLTEIMRLITDLATDQSKMASKITKISNEQSKMASEQIKISNEQSKMAMIQNQFTERLETVAYRQNPYSACVENLQRAKFPKSDVKSRTPEVAGGLDVPLGSSVDTTRGPCLGMGGGLPLDPAPWVRERDMQSSSPYHFGMIKKGGKPDYRWSLPAPCKESTGLPCTTSLTSHPRVNETRHHFADRVGVTGENENATLLLPVPPPVAPHPSQSFLDSTFRPLHPTPTQLS